ncbi:hypothetical protein D9M71_689140 [compost metagenome]
MKSRIGRITTATRSLLAAQIPSGMPSSRLIRVEEKVRPRVTTVCSQNPVSTIRISEAAVNRANLAPMRQRPRPTKTAISTQAGGHIRKRSISSEKPLTTLPTLSKAPL